MTRVLLRCPKDPFEIVAPEAVALATFGYNSGNQLFVDAAYKIVDTRNATVTPDRFAAHKMGADEINERFDVYVIPLANAFRVSFMGALESLTGVVKGLKIPVVVLGGGLQAKLPYRSGVKRPQDRVVTAFFRAVMDRSPSIGVRGEYTQDYLHQLGFRDVDVIGCPSMFYHGDQLTIRKRTPALGTDARIAINVTARVDQMGPIVSSHVARYPNLSYVGQEMECLHLLLWGHGYEGFREPSPLPVHASHPLVRDGKTMFWVDPWPWIEYLREQDFVFGTRIHGNIAGLLAGTPSYVLAHDTRTAELARYFEIPHRLIEDVPAETDAADLYAEADYGPLMAGHAARFATFTAFLDRHNIAHIFQPGEDPTAFDRRIAEISFPTTVVLNSGSAKGRFISSGRRLARRAYALGGRSARKVLGRA